MRIEPSAARPPATRTRRRRTARLRTLVAVGCVALATGLVLPASAQHLPQPEVAEPAQILPNGGFDAGDADGSGHPIGWAVTGSDAVLINRAVDKTAGPTALQVTNKVGSGVTVMSRREIATEDTTYTLTGKAKVLSGTGATVLLRFYDFNKKLLAEHSWTATGTGTFSPFTLSGTAPVGADLLSVLITGTVATAGVTVFDEFSLQSGAPAYDPVLGSARELFLDDYRIESANDVQRVVHPGKKLSTPVLRPDQPWETSAYTYGSAIKIGGRYRLWYTCYNDVPPNYFQCYAESRDGVHFSKPDLGLFEWNGSTHNNIVQGGGGTVVYNASAPADRRYALLTFRTGVVNDTLGYYGMVSPDGLHWTDVSAKPLLLDGDVSNLAWDSRTGRYIATVKKRMFTADTGGYDRSAFVATSTDFLHWTRPQLGVMGDFADDGAAYAKNGLESQIYGMPVLPYESIYIGVPWVFNILNFTSGEYKTAADGPIAPQLAASRDLLRWERPVRDALIEPGQGGAWDDGALYTASNIVVDDDSISMYYAGFNNGHGGAESTNPDRDNHHGQTGLASWRRDGFLSLTNASEPGLGDAGEVITKPITVSGRALHLNARVRARGAITVTVLDANGTAIPGFTSATIRGDHLDSTARFAKNASLTSLQGRTIKLKFSVQNADLYSYWVR